MNIAPLILLSLVLVLWLISLAVIKDKGWAWLPVASIIASMYLLAAAQQRIITAFVNLPEFLIFMVILVLTLYLASRLEALTLRVSVTALFLPLLFSVSFFVLMNAVIGSIG